MQTHLWRIILPCVTDTQRKKCKTKLRVTDTHQKLHFRIPRKFFFLGGGGFCRGNFNPQNFTYDKFFTRIIPSLTKNTDGSYLLYDKSNIHVTFQQFFRSRKKKKRRKMYKEDYRYSLKVTTKRGNTGVLPVYG